MGNNSSTGNFKKIKSLFKSEADFKEINQKCTLNSHMEPNRISFPRVHGPRRPKPGNLRNHQKSV